MKRIGIVPIALALTMAVGCDRNDRAARTSDSPAVGTSGSKAGDNVSRGDKDFINDLTIAGMAEVELGKLAVEKAANADVKKFGQQMIDDHTAAGDKLKRLASQHGIPVPTSVDDKHSDLRDDLSKKELGDFDRAYVDAMVNGHEDVLDKLASRIDKTKLGEWRTKMEERVSGRKTEQRAEADLIVPEPSDNPVTFAINQWAAEAYPIVYAHHEKAKVLDETVKKRTTN
jgi:putative membrane protein